MNDRTYCRECGAVNEPCVVGCSEQLVEPDPVAELAKANATIAELKAALTEALDLAEAWIPGSDAGIALDRSAVKKLRKLVTP